jgi:cobaltochelatase CobT
MAAWADILDKWCERVGIKLEILGFTTRAWKGGQSRAAWLANGKPANPGRLNDLRHIIYKSFEQISDDSSANLSIMMKEGVLKENIDGEALLWAYSRLEKQQAKKRILVVLSDGAPVDDSTLGVNPGNFLAKHLISTGAWLESRKDLELLVIGVNHQPLYYATAQMVTPVDCGIPIMQRLTQLIEASTE